MMYLDSHTTLVVMVSSHCKISWVPGGPPPLYHELGAHNNNWQMVAASLRRRLFSYFKKSQPRAYLGDGLSPGFLASME